jgi:hypothetical protein
MDTEIGFNSHRLERDQYGNRYEYDEMGNRYVEIEPMSLAEWRNRLTPRLRELGWDVPQLSQLEGFRLLQLERLIREAGMVRGFEPRPLEGSVGEALSAASIAGTKPTKGAILDQLQAAAESLPVECEYNQQHATPRREAREKYERDQKEKAAADAAAKEQPRLSAKDQAALDELASYSPGYR